MRQHATAWPSRSHHLVGSALLGVVLPLALGLGSAAHAADSGSIDHVETRAGQLDLLYSIPALPEGLSPDLGSVQVTVDGQAIDAVATPAGDSTSAETVQRTTVLAIDVSNSMRGERFTEAKRAAKAFLDAAPPDVLVGLVSFAGEVTTVAAPTLDRTQLTAVLDTLTLSKSTRLYDGIIEALTAAGNEGQRSVLVLSDGRDTSNTKLSQVTRSIRDTELKVDVVALEQSGPANETLARIATVAKGTLLTAADPKALTQLFAEEADTLANQVLISVTIPDELAGTEGSLEVSLDAGAETYSDAAFVTLREAAPEDKPGVSSDAPSGAAPPRFDVPVRAMWAGLGLAGAALLLVLLTAFGVFAGSTRQTIEERVAPYTRDGARPEKGGASRRGDAPPRTVAESAVGMAQKALATNKGAEVKLAARLDAAGLSLKPAEWLLLHAGIAVAAAVMGFLLSSGGLLLTVVLLVAGAVVPWVYLGTKKGRRLKAFNSHLAETLQLIAGSLSAGLSLAQSVDTVVREGTEPIAGEFRRALVETRLGVQLENALESVGDRMESEDFRWVVMAIRIQREVGGNLSQLLLSVAETMRERQYLRRQVKALSAEGRLSAYILCAMPPGIIAFLSFSNPDYLKPLFEDVIGWLLLVVMALLMAVGAFWMSRLVKVEV